MPDTVKSSDPTPIIRFAGVCKTFRYRGGASRIDDDDDDDDDAEAVSEPDETKSDDSGLKPGETRAALQNINFSIFPGERVGIIGGNGSGKSTLLSIVSGMSHPTSGIVVGRGSLVHLSEITKPFNPTWDGLRNLRVLAQFLGFRPELIKDNAARIARFAGMEDSILEPVATYSKGMFARLAFAAALELDGDIYIADDSIGVGDQAYQSKSFNRLVEICRSGKTLLFASHRLRLVEQLCTRVIWLDKGEVRADGKPAAVIANYCAATGDVSEQAIQDDGTQFGAWFKHKYIAEYPLPPTFILETRAVSNELVGEHASKIGGIVSLQLVTPQEPEGLVHENAALVVRVAIKVSSPGTTIDLMLEIIKGKLLVYQALIPEPLKVSLPQDLAFEITMDSRRLPDHAYRVRLSALFTPVDTPEARFLSSGEMFFATNNCGPESNPRALSFSGISEAPSAPIAVVDLDWRLVSPSEEIFDRGPDPAVVLQLA